MHQPRPYGLHVIGLPLTDKDESFISSVAMRISNLKELSGIDSMKMVYDLPDGGYVIVQDMGGNFRVIAHKPRPNKVITFDGLARDYIPMLYSGVVTKPIVYEYEPVGLRLTESARHRLRGYDNSKIKPAKDIELQRFRIDYDDKFQEFKPRLESGPLKTQYNELRPTWYSGAMAEVMQIVGGYGRQDIDRLPDEPLERATIKIPPEIAIAIKKEIGNIRLPAFTGYPAISGKFQYDYKFNNTNAVSFDTNNKPWLIKIGPSGVWAMPLPIMPATGTLAFREYMESVGDEEVIAILDRFGAMPSGETFPSGDAFEAWRRAGVIIKVCDTSDFYTHISYSSALGWSINSSGSEGYNTCYDYYDNGLGYGLTYKLRLKLTPADNHNREAENDIGGMLPERADRVRQYLNNLLPLVVSGTDEDRAVLYKIRRAGLYAIHERALIHSGESEVDYWYNLELEPIAKHSGNVSQVYSGYLYHPKPLLYQHQPQIKFPEPLMKGCISHDFLIHPGATYKGKYPNADTIMLAYYIGDALKVVKYFVDWNTFQMSGQGNFEAEMNVGTWWREESAGEAGVQGFFYSSDIDDREPISPKLTRTDIIGIDRGYDTKPYFSFKAFFGMVGDLWRNRYFTHKTTTVISEGRKLDIAVCVPYFCRNAVIQATSDTVSSTTESESLHLYYVRDPTSYLYWTYHPVFAYRSMDIANPKGVPAPTNGSPVWVEQSVYLPFAGSDFADNGEWIPSLPQDYTWLIHPNSNKWLHQGGGNPPTVGEYSKTNYPTAIQKGRLQLSINAIPNIINLITPDRKYYEGSPDLSGNVFYRNATAIVFGEAEYHNVSEQGIKPSSYRASWGYSKLADHKSAHIFIGVINE